jgi:hypothetical protein
MGVAEGVTAVFGSAIADRLFKRKGANSLDIERI